MRETKVVRVTLRVEVEVDSAGYPETAGRLAEMEAEGFISVLTATPNLNRASREGSATVAGARVTAISAFDSAVTP